VVPKLPRIVADDVTPEATAGLLADQDGRLAILSSEGGIFDVLAGRYHGNVPNLDVWLKGHSGDFLKVDRRSRQPEYVARPALTVGLMAQPAVLDSIARVGVFRGRGLLARFLYALPETKVGRRDVAAAPVDAEVATSYADKICQLAVSYQGWTPEPAVLVLDADAAETLVAFERALEPRLCREGGDLGHIADWAAKLAGATVRLAGLLHLADHLERAFLLPITGDSIRRAVTLAEFFTAHALAAFERMGTDPAVEGARYLLQVLDRLGQPEVSVRDLHMASSRSRFPKVKDLEGPLGVLADHGYLARLPDPPRRQGRPSSPRFAVLDVTTEATQATVTLV
jgi:hypothetical protein